ncbi:SUMF1/EgtB/PvdO family nonheme iron enzyme [Desulfobulbus sp. US4]|nr:SUMF1/EgtB/PvdO family nonheme iron enzyme [Desulfobulbus sp. US4]
MAEKRYAILIASSSYPDEPGLTDLRCPANDVDALDKVLRSPDLGGFTETVVFKNRPSHEVLERIETVLGEAGREDLVLIYFSGHGKLNPAGQLCLATANTKLRALGSTSIQAAEIKSYFDHSASRKKILLLDCCYSGAVGKDFTKGGVGEQLQLMSRGQGTFIMTASTGIEVAVEKEGDTYGLFTKHLVEGIRSGEADKDEDGFVDMQELYEYVHEKVRGEGAQQPMKWDLHAKGKLVIARSGKASGGKQLREAKSILFRLAAEERLTESIVFEAVKLLTLPKQEMTAKDQECSLLVRQLVGTQISPPVFIEQWVRACITYKSHKSTESKKERLGPSVASQPKAPVVSPGQASRPTPQQGDTIQDEPTGMELVYIPKGCFQMGSNEYDGEKPVHEVCVDGFWMGKYEVTQGQWKNIMGDNPANFQKGDDYPVEQVSWEDAQKFITQLKKRSGKEYRLPTEAEWEYAARAKSSYKYSGGDDLNAVAWYDGNSGDSTHPVGQKKANAFGLHDMSGNVWEWCADWYGEKYYASSPKNNPTGPDSGAARVLRGGDFFAPTGLYITSSR